jgi:virulence factor Mce-like protein
MRRVGGIVLAIALAAGVAALVVARRAQVSGGYRVVAVFDNAKGIVPGQDVKIAGAIVGTVSAVDLGGTRADPKARITMRVDRRFAPFSRDARCSILPDGLIAENYVECDPGRSQTPLAALHGLPTVPLGHTTLPVSLPDVLHVLSLPTDERLRVLISELGIATAGRGSDLNQLLLRANPTLLQFRRALAVLDSERQQLGDAVGQTDAVLGRLAAHTSQTRSFVDNAATALDTTAAHRTAAAATIHRLPALLAAADPALTALDRAASNAPPLLAALRDSAPGLEQLTQLVPQVARVGIPALRSLSRAAATGRIAVRAAAPVVTDLDRAVAPLAPLATDLYHLLVSTRDAGGFEGLLRVPYGVAVATSLYDSVSHLVTLVINLSPACIAGQQLGFDVRGCSHRYAAPGQGELPINDPSCGPVSPSWFDVHCPVPVSGLSTRRSPSALTGAAAHTPTNVRSLAPLVSYLVK